MKHTVKIVCPSGEIKTLEVEKPKRQLAINEALWRAFEADNANRLQRLNWGSLSDDDKWAIAKKAGYTSRTGTAPGW